MCFQRVDRFPPQCLALLEEVLVLHCLDVPAHAHALMDAPDPLHLMLVVVLLRMAQGEICLPLCFTCSYAVITALLLPFQVCGQLQTFLGLISFGIVSGREHLFTVMSQLQQVVAALPVASLQGFVATVVVGLDRIHLVEPPLLLLLSCGQGGVPYTLCSAERSHASFVEQCLVTLPDPLGPLRLCLRIRLCLQSSVLQFAKVPVVDGVSVVLHHPFTLQRCQQLVLRLMFQGSASLHLGKLDVHQVRPLLEDGGQQPDSAILGQKRVRPQLVPRDTLPK
mmetsp:Transcript_17453/g.45251  ORF Transcript_17453/g.45251 Transcript_17453/m.45251 type:complete len:280 (-) Transcript_17453:680-1519(-)